MNSTTGTEENHPSVVLSHLWIDTVGLGRRNRRISAIAGADTLR